MVRNTFIEIQQPADENSGCRASSLPHSWRVRDQSNDLIGACTRLVISNSDSISTAPTPTSTSTQSPGPLPQPKVAQVPKSGLKVESTNFALRLNALDLCVPRTRAPGRTKTTMDQASTKSSMTHARSLNSKSRSRSASSDRSGCSGNSHRTVSTGCDSNDAGSSISSGSSCAKVNSPISAHKEIVVRVAQPKDVPEETSCVSGSRRSRRRRAAARKAADQAEHGQLRIHAPLFQPSVHPTSSLPAEMFEVVSRAQASVLSCPHVSSVQIIKPESNQTRSTSIVITFHPGKVWAHDLRTLAKNALLEANEKSEQIFILGYGVDPFFEESDLGFTATIGRVPVDRQHSICWDFWRTGFCQRLSTCRWCHPVTADLMDVKFVLQPAQLPLHVHSVWNGQTCQLDSGGAPTSCWMVCGV